MLSWPVVSVPGLLASTALVSTAVVGAPGIRPTARSDAERGGVESAATDALVGRRR